MKFVFYFLLFCANNTFAQDSTRFLIKADQYISEVLTPERIYKYPDFSRGKIFFRDNTITEAILNYNYLNGEVEFINPANDTLAIAKHQMLNIQHIILNKDTFYYDDGYLQQILKTPVGRIAKRQMLVILKREKLGAYNQPTSTTNVESMIVFKDAYGSTSTHSVKARENITMTLLNQLFLGDNYSFLPASRKNLLKMFSSKKSIINNYLDQHHVDFKSTEDLQKLLLFLQ
jgi:hypothetical protein